MRTVAAVSTPRGKGGVAMIRISGEGALNVADGCFAPSSGKKLSETAPRTAVFGVVADNCGAPVDSGVAVYFAAPKSYTGEDVVEITCHGGTAVTAAVLEAVFAAGAFPASAGEFTQRAFINGKLSLTEAEGVGRLIDADTEARRALAYNNASGTLSGKIEAIRASLQSTLAKLYAVIDYPDEDLDAPDARELLDAVAAAENEARTLAATYKAGRAVTDGVRTVLAGKPNAGKSSLFNLMCKNERSIVTNVPGTTRDFIESAATVGGVTLNLCDTAGIRDSEGGDAVERIGIERSREKIAAAELVIFVADAAAGIDAADEAIAREAQSCGAPVIAAVNKSDAGDGHAATEKLRALGFETVLTVSAKTGGGLDALDKTVADMFARGIDLKNDAVVCEARQASALLRAADFLRDAAGALTDGFGADIAGVCVECAMNELDLTDGRSVNDDIINEIFSRFCVGK